MSPERGDMGPRTNHRLRRLDRGRGFKRRRKRFSTTTASGDTRAGAESTRITADITFLQQGHRPRSEENKQFDPGVKGEKAPPWDAAVTLPSFSGESWKRLLACASCFSVSALYVSVFQNHCFLQVITSQRTERHEGRRGSSG